MTTLTLDHVKKMLAILKAQEVLERSGPLMLTEGQALRAGLSTAEIGAAKSGPVRLPKSIQQMGAPSTFMIYGKLI